MRKIIVFSFISLIFVYAEGAWAGTKYVKLIGDDLLAELLSADSDSMLVRRAVDFYGRYIIEMKTGNIPTLIKMHNEVDGSRAYLREELKLIPDKFDDFKDAGKYKLNPVVVWGSYVIVDVSIEWKGQNYPWREVIYCDRECSVSNIYMRTDSDSFNLFKLLLSKYSDRASEAIGLPGYEKIELASDVGGADNLAALYINKNSFSVPVRKTQDIVKFVSSCFEENKRYWGNVLSKDGGMGNDLFTRAIDAANDRCWVGAKMSTVIPLLGVNAESASVGSKEYIFTAALQMLSRTESFKVFGLMKGEGSHVFALTLVTLSDKRKFILVLPLSVSDRGYVVDTKYYRDAGVRVLMSDVVGAHYLDKIGD